MNANPYEAPVEQQSAADQSVYPPVKSSWRIAPAVLCGLAGTAVTLLGLMMIGGAFLFLVQILSGNTQAQQAGITICLMSMIMSAMILGAGVSWLKSAMAFWKCRWEAGCMRFVVGFGILAVPVVLMVIAMGEVSQ